MLLSSSVPDVRGNLEKNGGFALIWGMELKWQEDDFAATVATLQRGGTILYPTDSIWGLGCDAESTAGIEQIYALKDRPASKSMILLADGPATMQPYVDVPDDAVARTAASDRPLTIVYPGARALPEALIAADGSIAVRITSDPFCRALIAALGRPLVSTSANLSGQSFNGNYSDVPESICTGVDYAVKFRRDVPVDPQPSRIIRMRPDGTVEVLRD